MFTKENNQLAPKFTPERFIVHERKGTKIVAKNQRHIITRNVSHFKKSPKSESNMKRKALETMRIGQKRRSRKKIKTMM